MIALRTAAARRRADRARAVRHALGRAGRSREGLQLTSDSLLAFQRDLEARGLADRVLVHVWTEFGRRAPENGDAGTDHGAAGVGFLIGTRARDDGRRVPRPAERPRRGRQRQGDRATSAASTSLLEQWLGVDAARVIPGASSFARSVLVR